MRGSRGLGTLSSHPEPDQTWLPPWPGHFQVLLSCDSESDLSMGLIARGEGSFL